MTAREMDGAPTAKAATNGSPPQIVRGPIVAPGIGLLPAQARLIHGIVAEAEYSPVSEGSDTSRSTPSRTVRQATLSPPVTSLTAINSIAMTPGWAE
jgi:hypothetical protein